MLRGCGCIFIYSEQGKVNILKIRTLVLLKTIIMMEVFGEADNYRYCD